MPFFAYHMRIDCFLNKTIFRSQSKIWIQNWLKSNLPFSKAISSSSSSSHLFHFLHWYLSLLFSLLNWLHWFERQSEYLPSSDIKLIDKCMSDNHWSQGPVWRGEDLIKKFNYQNERSYFFVFLRIFLFHSKMF